MLKTGNIKQPLLAVALTGLASLIVSCDEGRIYPEDGVAGEASAVTLEGTIHGIESWPEGYTVSLAGFDASDEYALISRNISIGEGDEVMATLTNIPEGVATIEVCVIDRLRRRVATFKSQPYTISESESRIRVENLDMSMSQALQQEIFSTTCANCHGGSGYAAANLNLTPGHSVEQLVGVESQKVPGMMRVKPGDAANSLLYEILTSNQSTDWNYDHSKEIYDKVKLDLIKNWIEGC